MHCMSRFYLILDEWETVKIAIHRVKKYKVVDLMNVNIFVLCFSESGSQRECSSWLSLSFSLVLTR